MLTTLLLLPSGCCVLLCAALLPNMRGSWWPLCTCHLLYTCTRNYSTFQLWLIRTHKCREMTLMATPCAHATWCTPARKPQHHSMMVDTHG
jgi:hypothetical protein